MTLFKNLRPDLQDALFRVKLVLQVYEQAKQQNNIISKGIVLMYESNQQTDSNILALVRDYAKKDKAAMERLFSEQVIEDILNLE